MLRVCGVDWFSQVLCGSYCLLLESSIFRIRTFSSSFIIILLFITVIIYIYIIILIKLCHYFIY